MMNIWNKIKQIIYDILIEPLVEAKINYLKIYNKDSRRGILLMASFVLLSGILFLIFISAYSKSYSFNLPGSNIQNSNKFDSYLPNSGSSEDVDVITKLLSDFVWPIFEDYIGNTPDPTGKSYCYSATDKTCTFSNGNDEIQFSKTDTTMTSAQQYSATLMMIIGPIFVLLCVIQGFNIITNENHEDIKKLFKRFIISLILLILTPYLLSFSVILVNLLTNAIMSNESISSSLNSVVGSIITGVSQNEAAKALIEGNILVYFLKGRALSQMFTFLCIAIPFGLVLLLLIYICFQFIIRFLNLYFLTAVYPFVIIFNVNPKTQSIVNTYFKQWTTFIIQQPVFMLGFKIVIDMLSQLTNKGGNSLQYLIIFIGILLFLASINIFASRIWGDMYGVITQNLTAAVGAHGLLASIKNPFTKNPFNNPANTNGVNSYSIFNVGKDTINTSPAIDLGGQSTTTNPSSEDSPLKPKEVTVKDNRSSITKSLDGAGYDVLANQDGTTAVSGLFYTNKDQDNELATLYLNKSDAINDGIIPQNVQPIGINGLNFLDTSNIKAASKYNNEVNQLAATNGVKMSGINIGQNSLDKKVYKSMNFAKNENFKKNIQGIGIKNDLKVGDRSISSDNKIKIIAYKEYINNQINGTGQSI